jgi:hypothetical protein
MPRAVVDQAIAVPFEVSDQLRYARLQPITGLRQNGLELFETVRCSTMPKPPLRRLNARQLGVGRRPLGVAQATKPLQHVLEAHRDVEPVEDPLNRAPGKIGRIGDIFAPSLMMAIGVSRATP